MGNGRETMSEPDLGQIGHVKLRTLIAAREW